MAFHKESRIRQQQRTNGGFTLVELLVTIVIFVLLTSLVLFSQGNFNNTVLLNNLAYDLALSIRQAQDYGTSIREFASSTPLFSSYGMYFNTTVSNKNFVLFADTTGDNRYNGSVALCPANDPECIQKYSINNGSFIKSICAGADSAHCNAIASYMNIMFKRPNPDAGIYMDANPTAQNYAAITLSSVSGTTRTVVVTSVGQIYVQKN